MCRWGVLIGGDTGESVSATAVGPSTALGLAVVWNGSAVRLVSAVEHPVGS